LILNSIDENGTLVRIKTLEDKADEELEEPGAMDEEPSFSGSPCEDKYSHEGKNCYQLELVPHHKRYPKDIHIYRRHSHLPPIQRDFSCWT